MPTPETVSEYISYEPTKIQKILKQMRAIVNKAAPRAKEKIAWGMPTLYLEGNVLHYAAFRDHLSLFPGAGPVKFFAKELSSYVTSKGTIQFSYEKPLPVRLIAKIAKHCVKRNLLEAKVKSDKKKKHKKKKKA